ncbi:hypothetical protein OIU77_022652 [Salix suchowensis]|uniref:Protein TIFY n=3 Tax=Salix TaxID=40685 RepID=A0A9Q0Q8V3_9ROSI|nr:protein TIFY [Salix suchowensis]KAJ6393219.1 hypothetical protein OIU77_022652 [Salix suchowensis]KAJ6702148.1 PROTEIN TIFY 4A-RELATED-RELATED [Salix koriyanagi]
MSRVAAVELDFFAMGKENKSPPSKPKFLNRQRSFRDIQSAISKINPELLKSVIASGSAAKKTTPENGNQFSNKSFPVPCTPKQEQPSFTAPPLYSPLPRPSSEILPETAPLTIFYNGTVAVFNVPRDKAENILKLAEKGISMTSAELMTDLKTDQQQLFENLDEDLPIARRKSLQRFLEKRKGRLTSVSPYVFNAGRP